MPAARSGDAGRRQLLDDLRCIALHLETATLLELRAARSANPTLATILRERAQRHRGAAVRLRAEVTSPQRREERLRAARRLGDQESRA